MEFFQNSKLIARIKDNVAATVALIATAIVLIILLAVGINQQTSAIKVPSTKFSWTKTTVVDEEQRFYLPEPGSSFSYVDAGFKSGNSNLYLGQTILPEVLNVLEEKGDWVHAETISKSIQLEVFKVNDGKWYIQSMRCCNSLVPTTRGIAVGMTLDEAMVLIPSGTTTFRDGNDTVIAAEDTLITLKLDGKKRITEIFMQFSAAELGE